MPKVIQFEGQTHEFPDDFTDVEISNALKGVAAPSQEVPQHPATTLMHDVLKGAGKGVARTALGAVETVSNLVQKIPGMPEPLVSKEQFASARQMTDPSNTAQRVGQNTEQVAELFAGGAGKLGIKAASKVPAVLSIPARMAGAAVESGGVTAAQTGGDPRATAISAGLGAATNLIPSAASAFAKNLREDEAVPLATKYIKDLTDKATTKLDKLPKSWQQFAQVKAPGPGDLTKAIEKGGELIKKYGLTGKASDAQAISRAPLALRKHLTELSAQLEKPHSFGWLSPGIVAGALGYGTLGANPVVGVPLTVLAGIRALGNKYPGPTAKFLDTAAPYVEGATRAGSGSAATILDQQLEDELLRRQR